MSVYVGQQFSTAPYKGAKEKGWVWKDACHMYADTVGQLHRMADKIGLKREWFQPLSVPHYDLTKSKRKLAIQKGAKPISRRQEGEMVRAWRKKTNCPDADPESGL